MLQLIRSGAASSRSDIARITGVSASTAAARVELLLAEGWLTEAGPGASQGGRRPRKLEISKEFGVLAAADLGTHHATLAVLDLQGEPLVKRHLELRIEDGPATVLQKVWDELSAMVAECRADGAPVRCLCIGLPGPVDSRVGRVVSPSRMPGWGGVDVRAALAELTDVPVLVDNDANLMALGEFAGAGRTAQNLIFVKAGTGIGCGVIASGRLHRGSHGAAGDISHVPVAGAPDVACSCGRTGCLEAVASGAALVRDLRASGIDVEDTGQVIQLARDAEPVTVRLLRDAGRSTGAVLAAIVNFFNPDTVVLGGLLTQAEVFVAGLRSTLYERCLPMATESLDITVSRTGPWAGVLGAGQLALDHVFDPVRVNATLEAARGVRGRPAN